MAQLQPDTALINEQFQIETHGIDIIPESGRTGSPRRLFWIWLGGTFYVNGLIVGGLLPYLGLNLWESLLCILASGVCTIGLGVFTVFGSRYGTSTMVIGRATLGRRGQIPATLLTWLGAVGWECVVSVVAALLCASTIEHLWPSVNHTAVEAVSFVVVLAGLLLWSLLGHATILKLQKPCAIISAVLILALIPFLLAHGGLAHVSLTGYISPPAGKTVWASWLFAFMILMSSGCWGWTAYSAEYARYLPKETKARPIISNVFWGSNIGYIAVLLIGLFIALTLKTADPVTAIPTFLPTWFLALFVLAIVISTWATGVLDAYTSGLALLALGLKVPRPLTVIVDAVLVALGGIYALFIYNFIGAFEEFLGLSIAWLAAWNAVILVDQYSRRKSGAVEEPEDLLRQEGGIYWFRSGVNPKPFVAFIAGTIAAVLFLNDSPLFVGPGSSATGNADLSIEVGTVVSIAVYLVWTVVERRRPAVTATTTQAASVAGGGRGE
jgi:NCS1 family nucleobase:cation symporter-1